NASTAAWRSRRISSGSESAKNQSVRVVWLATRLFQSSDIEPPTIFRCPRNFDTSWTCTSGSDLGGLFVLMRYVLMLDAHGVVVAIASLARGGPVVRGQLIASRFYEALRYELKQSPMQDTERAALMAASDRCERIATASIAPSAMLDELRNAIAVL